VFLFIREELDISRVLFSRSHRNHEDGYLSRMAVARHLQRSRGSFPPPEQVKDQPLLLLPCFQPGFTEPAPLDAAGALLPHLCTLT